MLSMTIGIFDGVHRGHQKLLAYLISLGGRSLLITFSNHPAEVFGTTPPPLITPPEEKLKLLHEYPIDQILMIPFTPQIASRSYQQFLAPYPIQHLVLGEGAALGAGRQGTLPCLQELGRERGFTVHIVPHLYDSGEPISSSRIRALLAAGKREEAETLLGRKL